MSDFIRLPTTEVSSSNGTTLIQEVYIATHDIQRVTITRPEGTNVRVMRVWTSPDRTPSVFVIKDEYEIQRLEAILRKLELRD